MPCVNHSGQLSGFLTILFYSLARSPWILWRFFIQKLAIPSKPGDFQLLVLADSVGIISDHSWYSKCMFVSNCCWIHAAASLWFLLFPQIFPQNFSISSVEGIVHLNFFSPQAHGRSFGRNFFEDLVLSEAATFFLKSPK